MAEAGQRRGGPALQLLAAALRLWIRQQCEAIDQLELDLDGSALQLLGGHLDGVRLQARRVRYQGLELESVTLRSEPIQVQLGKVLRGQPLQLDEAFRIRGLVRFTPEGLDRSLAQQAWRPLADSLAETLLGIGPLLAVTVRQPWLVLKARIPGSTTVRELDTRLQAELGSIALHAADGTTAMRLPMDPAITIERAAVEGGLVVLEGEATVTP
ncbi:DUF2993 domain-containing protein [Cyanobium sp. NIES-981]|uniref:LmeA family phospholipid-binding protein n=1 Tax=Cyanobium sp. NIES-981 TaxID=1851505 RepID=UPI000B35E76B|nr:DUF2993 domain-containing protein [Cyanobium sp. NIES-981]